MSATNQIAISATGVASQVAIARERGYLLVQNYASSSSNMYVRFNATATVKTGGEIEIVPGSHYERIAPQPVPQESISIISDGTAIGSLTESF